ncbi:MAG: ethylbenzene dehydrogenase [Chloroflexi bacterium]|nr:hypothetical protein [Chloroflexota bacterium]MBI5081134.1 ethylbenzene dehydrogenase [Chloroflexota bacterium]MBI5349512.1 ethylbenzene dehydrogenase [Chloroflexota bacterium]
MKHKLFTLIGVLAAISMILAACATPTTEAPKPTDLPKPTAVPPTVAPTAVPPTAMPAFKAPEGALVSVAASADPKLDGVADDAMWKDAPATQIKIEGGVNNFSSNVVFKSVYTKEKVYFLMTYDDKTNSEKRSPWLLKDGKWAQLTDPNDKGGDNNVYYEDKFSMIWPISTIPNFDKQGCFVACHAGEPNKPYGNKYLPEGLTADIWHWKSQRNVAQVDDQYLDSTKWDKEKSPDAGRKSDPNDGGGYKNNIDDKTKLPAFGLAGNKPAGAGNYLILDGDKVPFDATKYKEGDMVPGVYAAPYKGDRGDISAAWKWADGKWTIEFARKLDTGGKTDVQFKDLKGTYYFGVAVFDNAQVRHAYQSGSTPFVFKP